MLNTKKQEPQVANLTNQVNAPMQTVSQPSSNEFLKEQEEQHKKKEPVIKSVPKDEVEFYELTEDEILRDATFEARPLVLDQSYKIKPLSKHYAFHWTNCKAGGILLNKALAIGWQFANPKDLLSKEDGGHQGNVEGDKIYLGTDLVLMKLPRHIYAGMIKGNLLRSMGMVKQQSAVKQAIAHAGNVVSSGRGQPNFNRDRVEFFQPEQSDLNIKDSQGREMGGVLEPTSKADAVYETL